MDNFFDELKEWSPRKHALLTKYLDGFTKILGGSKGTVYYVDGFAGPGFYGEQNHKGSAVLAAEYAFSLINKPYRLECINVEVDDRYFEDLARNTQPYQIVVRNFSGAFAHHVDAILAAINSHPTLFFLDPFGVKGIEWSVVSKVLRRPEVTEVLLRVDPKTIKRLAGFSTSMSQDAQGKRHLLDEYYGFSNSTSWEQVWRARGIEGLIELYMARLGEGMSLGDGKPVFICSYPIKSIDGEMKYYLIFATRHAKGAVLMSDTVCNLEETYEREVEEYQSSQPRQLSMFDPPKPTEEEIFANKINTLKEDIWQVFQGKTAAQIDVRVTMLKNWFGRVKGKHFTQAFKDMQADGRITSCSGIVSDSYTRFTFRP